MLRFDESSGVSSVSVRKSDAVVPDPLLSARVEKPAGWLTRLWRRAARHLPWRKPIEMPAPVFVTVAWRGENRVFRIDSMARFNAIGTSVSGHPQVVQLITEQMVAEYDRPAFRKFVKSWLMFVEAKVYDGGK